MKEIKKLEIMLKDLIKVLENEKAVLIKGDGEALISITEKKMEFIEKMKSYNQLDDLKDETTKDLVGKIDALQETNYLLTLQAISFQDQILKALSKNNTSKYNTYTSNGNINCPKEISIVDQSV